MKIDKNQITRETNEMLIRRFVASVGDDFGGEYSPHFFPEFSGETVALWDEIEERMKTPICHTFNRQKCLEEIRNEINKQTEKIGIVADCTTSYHVGLKRGLQRAIAVIENNVVKNNDSNTD